MDIRYNITDFKHIEYMVKDAIKIFKHKSKSTDMDGVKRCYKFNGMKVKTLDRVEKYFPYIFNEKKSLA